MTRKWMAAATCSSGAALGLLGAVALMLWVGRVGVALAAEPPSEIDGLERVEHKHLDHVYVLPGASLSGYRRIRLDPVDVSFDENWDPNRSERSVQRRLSASDIENIRSTVATEFGKTLTKELQDAGYALVNEDAPDVLRVTPMIVNLYVTAPERPSAGRSRTFVASSGHMTLVIALRDSVSGQFLARAVDTQQGRDTGNFQISNSVTNLGDARSAFSKWAGVLVEGLEDTNARVASAK